MADPHAVSRRVREIEIRAFKRIYEELPAPTVTAASSPVSAPRRKLSADAQVPYLQVWNETADSSENT